MRCYINFRLLIKFKQILITKCFSLMVGNIGVLEYQEKQRRCCISKLNPSRNGTVSPYTLVEGKKVKLYWLTLQKRKFRLLFIILNRWKYMKKVPSCGILKFINPNKISGQLSHEKMISSWVKITCYLHTPKDQCCYGYIINHAFAQVLHKTSTKKY